MSCESEKCPFLSRRDFSVVKRFRNEAILDCPSPTCGDFERNFKHAFDLLDGVEKDRSGNIYGCDSAGNQIFRVHRHVVLDISRWINGRVTPTVTTVIEKNPRGNLMSLGIGLRNAIAFPRSIPFALSCERDGSFTTKRPVRAAYRGSFMIAQDKFLRLYKRAT